VPIIDEERQFAGVTLVLADVTNLRKLDEMKSGMLSVVSHELKTPLTSIRMATHLLLEERVGPLNGKQQELLVAAREDADRLYEIIESLLDMSRIEAGRALIDLRPTAAAQLVRDAVAHAEAAYRERGVRLEWDVQPGTPAVQADAGRIGLVFSNLLGNALRYTASGGTVRVFSENGDDVVRFVVEDTGVGVAPEHLTRIFERFYRVPGQAGATGAGLGLAISKEIVEVHGGSIHAQSTPGAGSRFSFTLVRADRGDRAAAEPAAEVAQS
jgi:NtrC-family two-component system sensor histidine kinase KinB